MPVTTLNTQVVAGGPTSNKANLISKRAPFQLKYGPRPEGTPGRGTFDLMNVLGLERKQYSLCLRMLRMISFNCGVDDTKGIKFQSEQVLSRVFAQFVEFFPEFKGFEDQFWAPRALLYVALKGSSDTWRKTNPGLALAAREAAKAHKQYKPNPKSQLHRGRPTNKSKADAIKATDAIKGAGNELDNVANEIRNMSIDEEATGSDAEADEPFFNSTRPAFYGPSITPGPSNAPQSTAHVPVASMSSHTPITTAVSRTAATPTPTPVINAHAPATANVPPPVPTHPTPTHAESVPIFDCGLNTTSANIAPNPHSASNRPYPRMRAPAAIIALSNGTTLSTTSDVNLATSPSERMDIQVTTPVSLPAKSIESGSNSDSDSGDSDATEVAAGPVEIRENTKGTKRGKKTKGDNPAPTPGDEPISVRTRGAKGKAPAEVKAPAKAKGSAKAKAPAKEKVPAKEKAPTKAKAQAKGKAKAK